MNFAGPELAAILLVCGVIGALIASSRGATAFVGFLLGFFLGIIGVVITLFLKPAQPAAAAGKATRECPHCKEPMRTDASVCPHCQRESSPWKLIDGEWWVTNPDGRSFRFNPTTKEWIEAPIPMEVERPEA